MVLTKGCTLHNEIELTGHIHNVGLLCPLPGMKLATYSFDGAIKIWNLNTNECENTFVHGDKALKGLFLLSHEKLISVCVYDNLKVWNLKTGICEKELKIDNLSQNGKNFALYGDKLIVVCSNGIIEWDINNWKREEKLEKSVYNTYAADAMCLLPGGRIAASFGDNTIKIFDILTGKCLKQLRSTFFNASKICSLNGDRIAIVSEDGSRMKKVTILDLNGKNYNIERETGCFIVRDLFEIPGNKLAIGFPDGITIFDLSTEQREGFFEGPHNSIHSMCLLPGKKWAIGSCGKIKILSNPVYSYNLPDEKLTKLVDEYMAALKEYETINPDTLLEQIKEKTAELWLATGWILRYLKNSDPSQLDNSKLLLFNRGIIASELRQDLVRLQSESKNINEKLQNLRERKNLNKALNDALDEFDNSDK